MRRALVALLLTTACGTTVPLAQTTGSPNDGLGQPAAHAPGVSEPDSPGQNPTPGTGGQSRSTSVAGTGTGVVDSTGSVSSPATPSGGSRLGRGVTATTVRIGVAYQANLDAANRALGGGKITSGDQLAEVDLLVKDINSHGGLGGRKLVLDAFAYDAQSTQPYAVQDQVACAHFTQDTKVFAVVGAGLTQTFEECMEKAGTAVLGADIVRFDAADFRHYPHFFDVQELDLERLAAALADEFAGDGWAAGWNPTLGRPTSSKPKVGVVAFDKPRYSHAVRAILVPRLRTKGLSVPDADLVFVNEPTSQSDVGPAATQVQNAVLRFAQDGVTHVVLLDTHGGITQVFLNAADGQHYYPRYGMESGSGTQALLDGGVIRASQLAGAKGLGWIPALDLPSSANSDDGPWSSADRRHCISLMKAGGQSFSSTNAESIALLYCDQLWLLDRSLDTIPATPTLPDFTTALERLGSAAPNASLGASSYSAGKHVGVARGIEWSFDGACGCMAYGRARDVR